MRPIPIKQREEMNQMPFFRVCAKAAIPGHECQGRITWDHPLTYGGKQLIEQNWTVPTCAYGHGVDQFQDGGDRIQEQQIWIALSRSTDEQIRSISKAIDYTHRKAYLVGIYGVYDEAEAIRVYLEKHPALFPGIAPIGGPAKKIWHCVTEEQDRMIDEVIDFHKEVDGRTYSRQSIVDRMIREYHAEVTGMMSELGAESVVG